MNGIPYNPKDEEKFDAAPYFNNHFKQWDDDDDDFNEPDTGLVEDENVGDIHYSCGMCKFKTSLPSKYNLHLQSDEHKIRAFKLNRAFKMWRDKHHKSGS